MVRCPVGGMVPFQAELRRALNLPSDATNEQLRAALDKPGADNALLIDDAHRLLRPVIGGLADMDDLLDLARKSTSSCTWVFAIDGVIWEYFERAREARPLFDDVIDLKPWSEDGIVRLLESRSAAAGVKARFDELMSELPDDADEIDREELREKTRLNYYRLLWDYASGNPGVALHFWRGSLRDDGKGGEVVRVFNSPSTSDLERLPDSTVFVLRSAIQLEWASPEDIARATMLPAASIEDALRYCSARQYLEQQDGRYRVRWDWFRAITRFLQRRHLLVGGGA